MTVKKLIFSFFVGAVCIFPGHSIAWNDSTHMLIAKIAVQNLNPGVMDKIINLSENIDGEFPHPFDFESAACWANDISEGGMNALDSWHEKLVPYDPWGVLTEEKRNILIASIDKNCVSFALREAMRTLKDQKSGPWEKNFMLRILLHCIGDIHHPLHCARLYSPDFPSGDNGGRLFTINGKTQKNLREFWDNLAGNYMRSCGWAHEQTYEMMVEMELILEKIITDFPSISFDKIIAEDFNVIADESYQLAVRYAYHNINPGDNPSYEYVATARMIAYRQIALAGYRLAGILNEVFVD
jgi:hypothetical protein